MDKEKELPKRKSTRLKYFDYSSEGAYFVTICTQDRKQILSEIVNCSCASVDKKTFSDMVGEGLAPPESKDLLDFDDMPKIRLMPCGKVVEEQLLLLKERYSNVTVEDYVIMPDHIHAVIFLHAKAGGASPSPTLDSVICAFKSLTSRICKQRYGIQKIFQRSYMEHIVRDNSDYEKRKKYIYENPMRWYYNKLYSEEQ